MGSEDEKKRQIDFDDLNNEIAGRDVGRQARFLGNGTASTDGETKREREERELRSKLDQLLLDPEYARLYADAQSALDSAQRALDRAILQNAQACERLLNLVEDMENRAPSLENGEKVFRAADGHLYTASGRRLDADEAREIDIPDDAPSYEQYQQAQRALERARQRGRDLADRQTRVLDPARDRLFDPDNPMTGDELRVFRREMEEFERETEISAVSNFESAANPDAMQEARVDLTSDIQSMPSL